MKTMKIKAKMKNNNLAQVKVQIKHAMLTYDQAKKRGKNANFIISVIAKVGDRIVYELSSSQFLSKNPLLKFVVPATHGDILQVTWRDLSGKEVTEEKKIK